MTNVKIYDNLIAFHPGSYIEDVVDDLNITQREFAQRLGTSPKTVSNLINGLANITTDLAFKLERLTGVDYQTWMNLQNTYDKEILEIEAKKIKDEELIADQIDIKYFKDHGFMKNIRYSLREKVEELRKILHMSDLSLLKEFNPSVSYRKAGNNNDSSVINSNIMLELASNIARNKTDTKLDVDKLKSYFPTIKKMSTKNIDDIYSDLEDLLLDCGIVLVALPCLRNSTLNGATKRFKNGSVLLLITDRYKRADIFWFSLMHEISHIIDNDFYTEIEDYEDSEIRADKFAREFFIDEDKYDSFVSKRDFSERGILKLAESESVAPHIIVGRLQKDEYIEYSDHRGLHSEYRIKLNK